MSTTPTGRAVPIQHAPQRVPGLYTFASWMLLVAGVLHLMVGGVAVWESDWVVAQVTFGNLEAWGWSYMVWGAMLVLAGGLSLAQRGLGPIVGVVLSGFSMVLWFGFIFAAPYAAIAGIAINASIIYGLTRVDVRAG